MTVIRLLAVALALSAIGRQLARHLADGYSALNFFC
jgi:hypothetical protein